MIKEFLIKYDDSRQFRLKAFFISFNLLRLKVGESTFDFSPFLNHEISRVLLAELYEDMPADFFVSWIHPSIARDGIEIVCCSKEFEIVPEGNIIPQHDYIT